MATCICMSRRTARLIPVTTVTCLFVDEIVAVKIMESIHEVVEEIEEEYRVLRDLGNHANIPQFYGLFLKQDPQEEDQLWIAMEVRHSLYCCYGNQWLLGY